MEDMGKLHYCRRITIEHDEDQQCLLLHQKHYTSTLLVKYRMTEAKIVSTPTDPNVKLQKDDNHSKVVDKVQ